MCCGSTRAIRIVLIVLNVISMICGIGVLGVCVYLYCQIADFFPIISSSDPLLAIALLLLVGIGSVLCLFGLVGCCMTWHLNAWMMIAYSVVMIITVAAHIVCATLTLIFKGRLFGRLRESMSDQLINDFHGLAAEDSISKSWNSMQVKFQCCGSIDYMDWRNNTILKENQTIPMTCCKGWESPWTSNGSYVPPAVDVNACLGEAAIPGLPVAAFFNTKGCHELLFEWLSPLCLVVIVIAFSIIALEVTAIWASLNLHHKVSAWRPLVPTTTGSTHYECKRNREIDNGTMKL